VHTGDRFEFLRTMVRKNSTAACSVQGPEEILDQRPPRARPSPLVGSHIAELEKRMRDVAANLEFEEALARDEIRRLEAHQLGLPGQAASANVGVHLGRMQNSRVFRGVRTGSGGRPTRRSGR
jgi:hypothetical protein